VAICSWNGLATYIAGGSRRMSCAVCSAQLFLLKQVSSFLSRRTDRLKVVAGSFLLLAVAGCALTTNSSTALREDRIQVLDRAVGSQPQVTPFALDVVDEANDGQRLIIKGRLSAKQEWATNDVVLRLSALDELGEQRIVINRLSDVLPAVSKITPSAPADFTLAISSAGLSNYQLEVLWGSEAAAVSASAGGVGSDKATRAEDSSLQTLVLRGLEVHRLPDSSCASPDECRVKFTITGEFFNAGRATIREVTLLAGFSDADKLDLHDQVLENERQVEVRNMKLVPGSTKPFRLALDILVPPSQQMAPRPVIRIVTVKTE
jgi:hypothetical protein